MFPAMCLQEDAGKGLTTLGWWMEVDSADSRRVSARLAMLQSCATTFTATSAPLHLPAIQRGLILMMQALGHAEAFSPGSVDPGMAMNNAHGMLSAVAPIIFSQESGQQQCLFPSCYSEVSPQRVQ